MSDDLRKIEKYAFMSCSLIFVRLFGERAFYCCRSVTSDFVPPSCREIENTELGWGDFRKLELLEFNRKRMMPSRRGRVKRYKSTAINKWILSMNKEKEFQLHRICSEMDPSMKDIHEIMKRHGNLDIMLLKNRVGITPSEYLATNPFANVNESKIITRFILEKLGEMT